MTTSVHRKVGRPPITDAPLEQISVRLTPDEIGQAQALADDLAVSRNEAFRAALNEGFAAMKRARGKK